MTRRTMTRLLRRTMVAGGTAIAAIAVSAGEAQAHCDTMDGPVVTAARRALDTDSVSHALIWVRPDDEAAIRDAFEHARAVRRLGAEARALADRFFFETVVRVHRQGEGEPYTGLKPAGTDHGPAVATTDRALATGQVVALEELLVRAVREGLHERFARAAAAARFAAGDVEGGRRFVAAYVPLLHYAEEVHGLAAHAARPHEARPHEAAGMSPSTHPEPRSSDVSPLQRPIGGPALALDLAAELRVVHEQLATTSRTARTLVKNGPLRATLIGLAAGGELAPHSADGPITVQVLEGAIEFEADGRRWPLATGSLFSLEAGIVHTVRAAGGGVFLLTVAVRPEDGSAR